MRLQLLGTGSPNPLPERQGSAVLLSHQGQHLLVDAGRGVTTQLVRAGIAPEELSAVFLTHHHYDHIGNLGDLLLTAWHGSATSLPVIGPHGTDRIVQALFEQVYARELLFSYAWAAAKGTPMPLIQEAVRAITIAPDERYTHGDWQIRAAMVDHGQRLGLSYEQWPCLAYRVEAGGKTVVISGDTVACENLVALAHGADVLVQCCFIAEAELATPARRMLAERVIASSGQAGKIAAQAGVKRLVLTHLSTIDLASLAQIEADVRRDYTGPVYLGTDLFVLEDNHEGHE